MLIHITPRLLMPRTSSLSCILVDVTMPELGLLLKEGCEVTARKPYPNKRYLVVCRKEGQKAVVGLLLDTATPCSPFTVITRWAIEGEAVLTHQVHYVLMDHDHGAATDSMVLWHGTNERYGAFPSRWPESFPREWTPVRAQPRMNVLLEETDSGRVGDVQDTVSATGMIVARRETFQMPTVECSRLFHPAMTESFTGDGVARLPSADSAFKAVQSLSQ
ncbi:MAG: DUF6012 family protein [Rhodanobacter sp.]